MNYNDSDLRQRRLFSLPTLLTLFALLNIKIFLRGRKQQPFLDDIAEEKVSY